MDINAFINDYVKELKESNVLLFVHEMRSLLNEIGISYILIREIIKIVS
ncbi:hypothetical protein SDC9_94283 [bioreactor metagenome]|uniref:Uncharacterized protein n=1 Tax=bioreactor metagenome TaxID=1076179 RepID=A0A645A3F0_9ZZZZ